MAEAPAATAALAIPPQKPEPISYGLTGIAPRTFEDAWRFAKAIASSDLAPKDYKGKPENCLIAMQMGAELGLTAMSSIQNIAVINSRPSLWGDSFLAVILNHPQYEFHKEYFEGSGDQRKAVFEIKRRGHELHVVKFGVAEAKTAGLWGKAGPWTNYPERMMQMRARGFGCRDKFADALRGMIIAEEAEDIPDGPTIEAEPETTRVEAVDTLLPLRQEIADFYKTKLMTDGDGKRYNDARIAVLLGACQTTSDLHGIYDAGKAELAKRNAPVVEIVATNESTSPASEQAATAKPEPTPGPAKTSAPVLPEKVEPKPECPECKKLKAKCFTCIGKEREERVSKYKALLAQWTDLTGRDPEGPITVAQFEKLGRVPQEQEIAKAENYLAHVREENEGTLFER